MQQLGSLNSRVVLLTLLALMAFAGNSLLCRAALATTHIDAATFTTVRLLAGAIMLTLIVQMRAGASAGASGNVNVGAGNWPSALALVVYAAGFSFSYLALTTAAGALILFGAVQITMIGYGLWRGEQMQWLQKLGFLLAFGGLTGLLLPGLTAPPVGGALLMLGAGIAWGIYSLRGKSSGNPLRVTAGNFLRATPLALVISVVFVSDFNFDQAGILYAVLSGALASGIGYAVWYTVLPALTSTAAATLQLSVPVIAAFGGVLLLDEKVTLRLVLASAAILGGIALVILDRPEKKPD